MASDLTARLRGTHARTACAPHRGRWATMCDFIHVCANVFALSAWSLAACALEPLTGTTVPPYPDGIVEGQSGCLAVGESDPCRHAVAELNMGGKPVRIVSLRSVSRQTDGTPLWEVTDEVPYPALVSGTYLANVACWRNGAEDPRVLAVVTESRLTWLRASGWAYRIDEGGHFSPIAPDGVQCYNTALEAD